MSSENDNNNNNKSNEDDKIVSMVERIKEQATEGIEPIAPDIWTIVLKDGESFTLEGSLFVSAVHAIVDDNNHAIFSVPNENIQYCMRQESSIKTDDEPLA